MQYLPVSATLTFELGDRIGGGGEAQVFKAFDNQMNAQLAVKRIPLANFQDIDQFFHESQKLYLTRHHNIVQIMYGCRDNIDDFVYLAMPFYKNGSLLDLIAQRFLTAREVIRYSLQFLSGLNNVHSKRLIHFDIKCENILLSDKNQAMLSDFGLAQQTCQYGFATNFGTTQVFAPPELFNQEEHNLLFDIYQAGITLYRLCIGAKYFRDQYLMAGDDAGNFDDAVFRQNLIQGTFPNRSFWLPHIPIPLRTVIRKATNLDPAQRYSNVIDFLNDLSKIETANDWQFRTDYAGNEEWKSDNRVVTANLRGVLWNVTSIKGNRKKNAYCKTGLNLAGKNALLYKSLNEEW
jgi:serine/threonine protein kinase